jgi:hypothetical protein
MRCCLALLWNLDDQRDCRRFLEEFSVIAHFFNGLIFIDSSVTQSRANGLRQKLLYPERGMQWYLVLGNANSRESGNIARK